MDRLGMGFALLFIVALVVGNVRGTPKPQMPHPAQAASPITPPVPIDLGSTDRCGCAFSSIYSRRNGGCWPGGAPNLIGLEGYVKAGSAPKSLRNPPWKTNELKQTGPEKWDVVSSRRDARTRVRILAAHTGDAYRSVPHSRLQVQDVEGGQVSWISDKDFDPVPWWQCSPDKAVQHSPIIVKPRPSSRPVDGDGRWIEGPVPARLWCWTASQKLWLYCDARTSADRNKTWMFPPEEVEVVY